MNDTTRVSLEHTLKSVEGKAEWNRKQISTLRQELASREETLETNECEVRELKVSLEEG